MEGGTDDDVYQLLASLLNDVVNESTGQGRDALDFRGISASDITHTLTATNTVEVKIGTSGVIAQSRDAIELITGGGATDRFVFTKGATTPAVLDGGGSSGLPGAGNWLDYSAYVTPVTVNMPAKADVLGTATGTGGIRNITRITGGTQDDTMTAGYEAALLEGGPGHDRLTGSDLNDQLTGSIGDDTLIGGVGQDTAVYSGPRSNYTVTWNATTKEYTVSSAAEGTDIVSQVENFVFAGTSYSATSLLPGASGKLAVTASTWNGRGMKAVSLTSGAETDSSGSSLFDKPSAPLSLSPKLAVDANARSKIDLNDAIQILKSIVGLTTFNPYQNIAADFNNSNSVDLSDAIGVLKHIVGLSAPEPAWVFVDSKSSAPKVGEALSLGEADVQLVGILKGDVDGSWSG